jgi:hypothetical protein
MSMSGIRGRVEYLARAVLLLAMLAGPPAAPAQAAFGTDASDLWWSAAESGWGMQIVEEGGAAFATLFVYDASGQPTFFTATLAPLAGQAWSGDLYRTVGPPFGAASFNPGAVGARKVGALTFTRSGSDAAQLAYSVDGIAVRKDVTRQLLRYDDYSGTYTATVYLVTTHCSDTAANRAQTGSFEIRIDQTSNAMSVRGSFAHRSACTYLGTYIQAGRVGALGASYTCADGDEGAMNFFEMTRRPGMVSGRLQGHSITDSCDYSGAFTGLVPF